MQQVRAIRRVIVLGKMRCPLYGNWNFRTREVELSFPGTFVLNIKISMELFFPNVDY